MGIEPEPQKSAQKREKCKIRECKIRCLLYVVQ